MRRLRRAAALVVGALAVEAPVDAGEHLVRLVDDAQIERRGSRQPLRTGGAARVFAPDQKHAGRGNLAAVVGRLQRGNAEQGVQLVLPLSQERLGDDDEDPLDALGHHLSNHEAGLDRLAEPHLVGQNAAALRDAPQGEHHRVDLVRVGIDAPEPLRRRVAPLLRRPAEPHKILGLETAMNRMTNAPVHFHHGFPSRLKTRRAIRQLTQPMSPAAPNAGTAFD